MGRDALDAKCGILCVVCDAWDAMRGLDVCEVRCVGCNVLPAMCAIQGVRYDVWGAMRRRQCIGVDVCDVM